MLNKSIVLILIFDKMLISQIIHENNYVNILNV